MRKANLEKRQILADELIQYANNDNWQGIDWKAVDNLIKVAKAQWRALSPTERQANKPVQKQFDKAINIIQAHIQGEYQANIEKKEQLVKKANQLDGETDLRVATEQVKKLQAQWRDIGITPRAVDQKLWQNFRISCNRVFERRSEQSTAFKAELQDHKVQAQALLKEISTICELETSALQAQMGRIEELKIAFNELGALPKEDIKQLQTQFNDLLARFNQQVKEQKQAHQDKKWQDFFLLGELISKYEMAITSKSGEEELEQAVEKQLSAITSWPTGGEAVIRDRLAGSNQLSKEQQAANEIALRKLCIRMEILSDKATPAEDQALRMAYQVERLQQDFGQGTADSIDGLKLEWVSIGGIESNLYSQLFKRFIA